MNNWQNIIKTVMRYTSAPELDRLIQTQQRGHIGKPLNRVDGQLKVKGEATFSAEYKVENPAYAAIVYSSITKGRVTKLDKSIAEKASGVLAIITPETAPRTQKPPTFASRKGASATDLSIFQDTTVYWNGQPIAVIVAETQDQADEAAKLVRVEYETAAAAVSFDALKQTAKLPPNVRREPSEIRIGNAETALNAAEVKVDNLYHTPRYNNNAIESYATVAVWHDDGRLTVFYSTQFVTGFR